MDFYMKLCKSIKKIFLGIFIFSFLNIVNAQQGENPNIAYVYPAGAQAGSTVKILIAGKDLTLAKNVVISGSGIECKIGEYTLPSKRGSIFSTRHRLERLYIEAHPEVKNEIAKLEEEGKSGDAYLRKLVMAIPENIQTLAEVDASYYLRKISGDPMAETLEVEVRVDSNATAGERSLCVITENGISNSMPFMVGIYPEISKPSLRETAKVRARKKENWGRIGLREPNPNRMIIPSEFTLMEAEIPCVLNGQITEAKTDAYKFFAKTGQTITFSLQAQRLVKYISDAVPGWFQAVVSIRNPDGKEIAFFDDFNHFPDPSGSFKAEKDGWYMIEIRDAIHRSREDFIYRLTLGELPLAYGVFPPAVRMGEKSKLKIYGEMLEGLNDVEVYTESEDVFELSLENSGVSHNPIPIYTLPKDCEFSILENPNTLVEAHFPSAYAGRFTQKNQEDKFGFKAKKGDKLIIETFARRLNAPTDTFLYIKDSSDKVIASNDDIENAEDGLITHHADSKIEFTAPKDDFYVLSVKDAQSNFSKIHSYLLLLGLSQPDFSIRTLKSTLEVNAGRSGFFEVKAFRKNGFKGDILIDVKNLPEGFKVSGNKIPKGKDSCFVYITAPNDTPIQTLSLEVEGIADYNGKKIQRKLLPCDNMMQAFYYWHLTPAKDFVMTITQRNGVFKGKYNKLEVQPLPKNKIVKIYANEKTNIKIGKCGRKSNQGIICKAKGLPEGLKMEWLGEWKGELFLSILVDNNSKKKAKIGTKGEMSVDFVARRGNDTVFVDACPPFKFEIVKAPQKKKNKEVVKNPKKEKTSKS